MQMIALSLFGILETAIAPGKVLKITPAEVGGVRLT